LVELGQTCHDDLPLRADPSASTPRSAADTVRHKQLLLHPVSNVRLRRSVTLRVDFSNARFDERSTDENGIHLGALSRFRGFCGVSKIAPGGAWVFAARVTYGASTVVAPKNRSTAVDVRLIQQRRASLPRKFSFEGVA
jgi:hypothetical protein